MKNKQEENTNVQKQYEQACYKIENIFREHRNVYNADLPIMNDYNLELKENFEKEIIYIYILTKNANSRIEQEIYANALCRNLCSFLDLYSQILNLFYDLGLKELRKSAVPSINPSIGIIDQILHGPIKTFNGPIVTWENVKKQLGKLYQSNHYYDDIKKVMNDGNINKIKILRNYCTHNQPLFSRFESSYMKFYDQSSENSLRIDPDSKVGREYDEFIELSHKAIQKEIKLIKDFEGMVYDQKMVPKNDCEKSLHVFKCPKCKTKILVTSIYIIHPVLKKCPKCGAKVILEDTGEKLKVHPERYEQTFLVDCRDLKNELK